MNITGSSKYYIASLMATFFIIVCGFSQDYTVAGYQKINELNGGFNGILDIDDSWGIAIDNIGDLDGNGVNDLAVGAYGDDDGGSDKGAVWILFLDTDDRVLSFTKISNTSGNFNGVLDNQDRFGGGVAHLGDINNDGLTELAVTADYDADGGFWHGAVWILSLNSNGTVSTYAKISDTAGGFTGFINGDAIFGTDIENIGDLNSDGVDDLAVGSRRDADGGSARGAVWILFMNADLTVNSYQKISDTQGGLNATLNFEDYFGGSVLNIGDLDGDGVTDIVVGSYRDDDQLVNSGSFYVLFLNSDGTVKKYQKVSNTTGGLLNQISANALFGESIDGVLDIDNDGKIEIIVGALRQVNPTLAIQTGAFFIIELNTDGTVSEEHLYTYGENCFTGQLQNGDFFGGSVTLLKNGTVKSIAVGAYRDSENGPGKGSVWILNLGETLYTLSEVRDPSTCQLDDGSILISDLKASANYKISYTTLGEPTTMDLLASANGEVQITGLAAGVYEDITVIENNSGCMDNLGQVVLSISEIVVEIATSNPTSCTSSDGSITLSNLSPNTLYTIDYELNSMSESFDFTSDATGKVLLLSLIPGLYNNFRVIDPLSLCSSSPQSILLEGQDRNISASFQNPATCDTMNGSITIRDLLSNTPYLVSYSLGTKVTTRDEISGVNGEIVITGLAAGIYSDLIVTEEPSGCISTLQPLELTCTIGDLGCFKVKKFFTPNNDGANDVWSLEIINECDYRVYIYNRYGKLLVVLTPDNPKWNGEYLGQAMPASDYWYRIDYTMDNTSLLFTSHFTLKR